MSLTTVQPGMIQQLAPANMPSGSVLQVVTTQLTTQVSISMTTALTWYDISGLSVSITPKFSTSKIYAMCVIVTSDCTNGANRQYLQLVRNSTPISIGSASGSQFPASSAFFSTDGNEIINNTIMWLDSPATTSATTYKIQMATNANSQIGYVNRTKLNTQTDSALGASQITLMEIQG